MAKSKKVSFYGPMQAALGGDTIQRDYANDPRRRIAEMLMSQGSSTAPVQSPLEGITRALQGGLGGYFSGKARQDMQGREAKYSEDMAKVLAGGQAKPWVDPETGVTSGQPAGGIAGMLAASQGINNPDIIPTMQQLQMQQMAQQQMAQQAELARAQGLEDYKSKLEMKQQIGGDAKYGNTVIWGRDAQGNPVALQPSSAGGIRQAKTPEGVTLERGGVKTVDLGDKFAVMDANGNFLGYKPKGIGPSRQIKDGQVVTLPAIPGAGPQGPGGNGVDVTAQGGAETFDLPQSQRLKDKAEARRRQKLRAGGTVIQDLQRGLDILENDWSSVSAAISGVAKNIPLTDAKALDGFIQSALSNVGLDTLQTMRENSPTGGALGQVPIQQQKRLEQVLGSLDISQDPEIVKDNIKRVINIYKDIAYGTPEEIQALVDQGKITPEIAAQASDRYQLSFDVFGKKLTGGSNPAGVDQNIWDAMPQEDRALFQ